MWMLSFYKPCVIPLSETYMMLVWALHCAVLLEGLRTTATLIVFLLCSHNRVLLILRLTKLSQSRSSFPAQELSVSLGEVIPLVFLPRAAVFDILQIYSTTFRPLPQQSQHFSALHGDSVASSPECVFSLRWFTPHPFFLTKLTFPCPVSCLASLIIVVYSFEGTCTLPHNANLRAFSRTLKMRST